MTYQYLCSDWTRAQPDSASSSDIIISFKYTPRRELQSLRAVARPLEEPLKKALCLFRQTPPSPSATQLATPRLRPDQAVAIPAERKTQRTAIQQFAILQEENAIRANSFRNKEPERPKILTAAYRGLHWSMSTAFSLSSSLPVCHLRRTAPEDHHTHSTFAGRSNVT